MTLPRNYIRMKYYHFYFIGSLGFVILVLFLRTGNMKMGVTDKYLKKFNYKFF